ncbi:hypothetical protein UCDDA912_g07613 [Diaporthe ampelina]|uniref:Uncharacterized protein n=1 Tax=Diaporthe ampelina TaxID=1214573 RepID=A0A0G2FCU2_9PEZI|nr:hypothetical protein UCDDA912_g07613 [Diaporthe ampelina]
MDPIDPIEPAVPVAPEAPMTEPNGGESSSQPETNGHKEGKAVIEQDGDAIELATSSAKQGVEAKRDTKKDLDANVESSAKTGQRNAREATVESAGFEAESSLDPWEFEVVIKPLSPAAAQEYTKVPPGDEIYRVLEVIKTDIPGEAWLSVEFEDGRVDQNGRFTTLSFLPRNGPFGSEPSGKLSVTC